MKVARGLSEKNSSKVSKSVKKMGEKEGENQNAALSSGATDIDALQGKELGGVFAGSELLQSVEDAISAYLVTTPKGELIYCNKAFLKIFGFRTKEEASANPVSKLYYNPADRARFLSALLSYALGHPKSISNNCNKSYCSAFLIRSLV